MKKLIFIFLILSPALCKAQKDSIRYEMYVRCCMGEVSPNDFNLLYHVYKDTFYICNTDFDYQIMLPDTGCYRFENMDHSKGDTFTRCFEHGGVFRDTFDVFNVYQVIWDGKKSPKNPPWMCNECIMDGYIVEKRKNGGKDWEGLYKKGKELWYKSYDENGNLIYYSKRNFWGKEKVLLDKRFNSRRGKRKDEDVE